MMPKKCYYRVLTAVPPPNYRNVSGLFETREGAAVYLNEILAIDPFAAGTIETVDLDGEVLA